MKKKKKRTYPLGRGSKSRQIREPVADYHPRRRKAGDNSLLPGFETIETTAPHSDVTHSVEAAFRRYGLEGEDVFLAIAARSVQESHVRQDGFEFFKYERGLQVLDLVTHDRQVDSLLARVCVGSDAVAHLPVWYQYFVGRRFREGSGKFFTPKPVARSMTNLLPLKAGMTFCDPTCGGGTFLSEVARQLQGTQCELVGNDVDRTLVGLTEVVLYLTCTSAQKQRLFCDNVYDRGSFIESYSQRVDCILANPPFSLPLDSVGMRSALFNMGYRNSDAVFLDVCLELLREGGHLVCLLPHSIVVNTDYSELRSRVERDWDLCGIVTLPEGVFYMTASTTTRADIIHLRKKAAGQISPARVYFANAPTAGVALNSRDTAPTDNALDEVALAVRARGCIASLAEDDK
ncbi:MAG: HsdM family class I SAM-dependent methyltransferase [Thermodesulfobacteriota bacterium]